MSILQNGTVSPRHLVSWTTTGVVQDAGSSATPGVSSLGLFGNGGTPFSITNRAVPGAPVGIYSQLNAGVSSTAAYINVDTFGTTALPLDFNINGSTIFSLTASGPTFGAPLLVNSGGTGLSATPTNGQLLIGNDTGYTLNTLTAGTGVSITNAAGTITIANNSAASVSSVAQTFTGGLISVSGSPITSSGTLALTVAGTSGGIPYFNSGTSWATSAALTANALVIGGGAGAAPSTTTTGTGVITALGSAVSGSGGIALTTNPIFTTPTLGVASATSVNGLTISSTTGTLALANGSTLATSGAFNMTLTATAATSVTMPTSGTLATTANTVASFSAGSTGLTPSTATTGAITLGGTLGVGYGGTGLTALGTGVQTALGNATNAASGIVVKDTNANISANALFAGTTNVAAAGTTTVLTASSTPNWIVTGSGGQTYQLPDATTLPVGAAFSFNNNQSSGTIVVKNNSGTTVMTVQSGAFGKAILLVNSPAAGSWDTHFFVPSNAAWSTNTLSWAGSYSGGTWNGSVIGPTYGGTGVNNGTNTLTLGGSLTTSGAYPVTLTATGTTAVTLPTTGTLATTANTVASFSAGSTGLTPSTATTGAVTLGGTLGVGYGGTGLTSTPTNGQIDIGNGTGFTRTTLTPGTGISITNAAGSITIANSSTASVSSVAQTFTGGLISVSGSPITTAGTLALTVAGTSGGIPYFNSGTSWATSAALTANALVIGGGAGAAPSTTTTGTGVITALGNAVNTAGGLATSAVTSLGSLSTVGTITSGAWNGSVIGPTYGGTGVNNGTNTLTLGGSLTTSGAYPVTITATGTTSVTLPTTGNMLSSVTAVAAITGTPSSSTFLRGDGTWAAPSGGGNVSSSGTPSNGQIAQWTGVSTIQGLATTGSGNAVLANGPALSAPTFSTSATVTAGTNAQGQGALTSDYNVITTTAANPSGVTLPTATTGRIVWAFNRGTNPVNVYPASGAAIDALGTNAAITLPVNAWLEFKAASTTLWYSSTLHQPTIYGTITFAAGP